MILSVDAVLDTASEADLKFLYIHAKVKKHCWIHMFQGKTKKELTAAKLHVDNEWLVPKESQPKQYTFEEYVKRIEELMGPELVIEVDNKIKEAMQDFIQNFANAIKEKLESAKQVSNKENTPYN
jgi:hypothetical protein